MKKKWLIGLMALCLSFATIAFVGCGENDNGDNTNTEQGGGNENDDTQGGDNSNDSTPTPETPDGAEENEDIITPVIAEGLEYEESEDGTYYIVSGIGTCEDTDIIIPSTHNGKPVKEIGEDAFFDCGSLTSVVIGDSVTTIGEGAFSSNGDLKKVVIGESVNEIGEVAFADSWKLTDISVSLNNATYKDIDGNLYTKDGKILVVYALGKTATSFTIPNGVTTIGDNAFYSCISLTSIVIPDSVTTIGDWAFDHCIKLQRVEISHSIKKIGDSAFSGCYSLVEVVNKSSHITIEKGAKTNGAVGYYALAVYNSTDTFTGTKLSNDNEYIIYTEGQDKILVSYEGTGTDLTLPTYITKINAYAFAFCSSLTRVNIGNNVTSIGDFAFDNCDNLASVVIGNSVTTIKEKAFYGCRRLVEVINKSTHIIVEKGSEANGYVGYYALSAYNSESGVTVSQLIIDNGYIVYTDGEEKILVGYAGTETELTLPTYITKINQTAFSEYYNIKRVIIGNKVNSIGVLAFAYCFNLASVEIGDNVTDVGEMAFGLCGDLTSISVSANNENYKDIDGNLYSKDGKTLIQYAIGKTAMSFTIPDSVTTIGNSAFYNCGSLTSMTIPDSVTTIGDYAFYWCDGLTSVVIGDGVTTIGDGAFSNCSILTSITFNGTKAQWNAIKKDTGWNEVVPATKVVCDDGEVSL